MEKLFFEFISTFFVSSSKVIFINKKQDILISQPIKISANDICKNGIDCLSIFQESESAIMKKEELKKYSVLELLEELQKRT